MSTKLYDGFTLGIDADPFEFVTRMRAVALPVRARLDAGLLARAAATLVDRRRLGLDDGTQARGWGPSALQRAFGERLNEQLEASDADRRTKVSYDPHSLEVALGRDPQTGRVVGYPYSSSRELTQAVLGMPGVSEYGYWNNTDMPEGISKEQWAERKQVWDRVLVTGIPAESMLTVSLSVHPYLDTALRQPVDGAVHPLVRQTMPSSAARGLRALLELAWRRYHKTTAERGDGTGGVHEAFSAYWDLRAALAPFAQRAGATLGEITDAQLLGPLDDIESDDGLVVELDGLVTQALTETSTP